MSEQFRLHRILRLRSILRVLYPAMMLIAGIVLNTIAILSNRIEIKWWYPMFIIGAGAWLIYDVINIIRSLSFCVELSKQGISINKLFVRWSYIVDLQENTYAMGKDTGIMLQLNNGSEIHIPAGLDRFNQAKKIIKSKIKRQK